MQYKYVKNEDGITNSDKIIIGIDEQGAILWIPNDPSNTDWQKFQVWLSENNTPLAAD